MPESNAQNGNLSPFLEIDREDWAALAPTMEAPLSAAEITQLQGLGDVLDLREVSEVYLPLSGLLSLYVNAAKELHTSTTEYLGATSTNTPFVIGVAGSVAVGKSTIARLLHKLLGRWEGTPHVELVTTDGFLLPNAELERRGLMERKGFPESYDRRALLRFVSQIKSGVPEVAANVYSHLSYDIVPGEQILVKHPDVLIVEGLNVLQPATSGHRLAVSDLFDFTIYVDARTSDIASWYEERFLSLQRSAFSNPASYFHRISTLSEHEARELARGLWANINEPNLEQNILPTKARASLVLRKNANHTVDTVLLRKI
jgi:type I pantothenate kinase